MGDQTVQAEITKVGEHHRVGVNMGATLLEQPEIMSASFTESCGDDLLRVPVQ